MSDGRKIQCWLEVTNNLKINGKNWPPKLLLDLPRIRGRGRALEERQRLVDLLFSNHDVASFFSSNASIERNRFMTINRETFINDEADLQSLGDWILFFPPLTRKQEDLLDTSKPGIFDRVNFFRVGTWILSHPDDIEWTIFASP